MKGIRKAGILFAAVCMFAAGQGEAQAVSLSAQNLADWSALSATVPHPSDEMGAEAAIDGTSEGLEHIWDFAGTYRNALVFISTDHVANASDVFSFDVAGFNGSSWISGAFTGTAFKVAETELDSDDYALQFNFGSQVSRIGVLNSNGIRLSESGVDSGAEFDGAAGVPEPSTFMLLGSGLAGLAYIRRRINL